MSKMIFSLVDPDLKTSAPDYKEGVGKDRQLVTWGPGNRFPNELFQAVQESVTASSVINGTIEYLKGKSISFSNSLFYKPFVNKERETIESLVEALGRDYLTFGMYAIQVIYNKLDQIAELYHLPVEYIRLSEDRSVIYFNKRFGKYTSNNIQYDRFDPANIVDHKSQVYVYTNSGRRQVYGISPLNSILNDICAEGISSKYIKNSLESGLAARYIISLPNAQNLSDEDKEEIEGGIKEKFCGVENAGQFMLYFNPGDTGLEVTKVDQDDSANIFNTIRDAASSNIYMAFHATPSLFGDPSKATGFSANEYSEAFRLFNKMTLMPLVNVISRSFNDIFGEGSFVINDVAEDSLDNSDENNQ